MPTAERLPMILMQHILIKDIYLYKYVLYKSSTFIQIQRDLRGAFHSNYKYYTKQFLKTALEKDESGFYKLEERDSVIACKFCSEKDYARE